jgi:hypothetical protein
LKFDRSQSARPQYVPGRFGDALCFRGELGSQDHVIVPDRPAVGGNQMSASAWIMPAAINSGYMQIIGDWGEGYGQFLLLIEDGRPGVSLFNKDRRAVDLRYPVVDWPGVGRWSHLAFVADGRELVFYCNGRKIRRPCESIFSHPQTKCLGIGCKTNDDGTALNGLPCFWQGCLDEIAVFHRALSPDEVRALADMPRDAAFGKTTPRKKESRDEKLDPRNDENSH